MYPETKQMMEAVVERENMKKALYRVIANKGAPGVDGMTVDELIGYIMVRWPGIKEELLEGRYEPQPVRKVEIPKAGGKGMRELGYLRWLTGSFNRRYIRYYNQSLIPTFPNRVTDFVRGEVPMMLCVVRMYMYKPDGVG